MTNIRWHYDVPLICFLLRGSAVPLSGLIEAPNRSEARSRLKKLFGFDRVPKAARLEHAVSPEAQRVLDVMRAGAPHVMWFDEDRLIHETGLSDALVVESLNGLCERGIITWTADGQYRLVGK